LATDALEVSGIDAYYGDSHVLHAVSFALKGGRLLGLLGRNGAGKTTCMATIMGFLTPSVTPSSPARCRAASSKCSRSAARSWATRACC